MRCYRAQRLGDACDLIVVVGGDGSLLGVARDVAGSGVPVTGVNRGGLGFLADISPEDIEEKLCEVLDGNYTVQYRFLLHAEVVRDGERVAASSALNDVVVHPGTMSRMMEFSLFVNDRFVYEQRSDGLIVRVTNGFYRLRAVSRWADHAPQSRRGGGGAHVPAHIDLPAAGDPGW